MVQESSDNDNSFRADYPTADEVFRTLCATIRGLASIAEEMGADPRGFTLCEINLCHRLAEKLDERGKHMMDQLREGD